MPMRTRHRAIETKDMPVAALPGLRIADPAVVPSRILLSQRGAEASLKLLTSSLPFVLSIM